MRFRMLDGHEYMGRTYRDVVYAMSQDKIRTALTLKRYRQATARRVAEAYEVDIDTATDARFIHSLEKAGLMERVA